MLSKKLLLGLGGLGLSLLSVAPLPACAELTSEPSVREQKPHQISLGLESPKFLGLNYRYSLNSDWSVGPVLAFNGIGLSVRRYFAPTASSAYLELQPVYHLFLGLYDAGRPAPALNARLGWQWQLENGLFFDLFGGLGLGYLESATQGGQIWALVNLGTEFGFAF